MARIPESELARLKQTVPLLGLIRGQGQEPRRQGKDWVIACPFHDDDTPSLVITEASNLFHCFGCGAAGSVVDWVMKTQGVSFRHAVELLRSDASSLAASDRLVKQSTTPKLAPPFAANAGDQAVLRQVIDFYHETLQQSPEALDYLKGRGLDHPELITTFKLGYANRTLGYRLPKKNRKAGAQLRGQLQSIGLIRESGHEHFSGCLVIPVIDAAGAITEVYGRKLLGQRLRKGTPQHLYLPGPHRGVFNAAGLRGQCEVIVCESLIDALTFWGVGLRNVTASYGTMGFTDELLAALEASGAERVLIAYDRDEAGNTAAKKLAKKLAKAGLASSRVLFPKGMDANEYACKVGPAAKSLALVVRAAEQMTAIRQSARAVAPPQEPGDSVITTDPLAAAPQGLAEITEQEITLTLEGRQYRVRGLDNNRSDDQLKVTLLLSVGDELHVDTLDLYAARARQGWLRQAGGFLRLDEAVLRHDLGVVLRELEQIRAERLTEPQSKVPAMTAQAREAALAYLRAPKLLERIAADLEACGLVGEASNKQVAYLGCISRLLHKPLAVLVQSNSAAGKSALLEGVLSLVPEESRLMYSAMSGQSLYYMNQGQLQHKVLAIAEEEGVRQASYALKLLQSQGGLTMASTGKDPNTGRLTTEEYRVEGPVMLFLTTTAVDLDEELRNRCVVLTVDEGRDQTRHIHRLQRRQRTLQGLLAQHEQETIAAVHHDAQRLLRALPVVNPYAEQLTFVDDQMRTRRDHEKYLTLIDAIALLHQYQRPLKQVEHRGRVIDYIEVTRDDIEAANALAHEVLGRSLDELPPHTRNLLGEIDAYVQARCRSEAIERAQCRFSRRELREHSGRGDTQLRVHLQRLVDLEYLHVHRGRPGRTFTYELVFDGDLRHDGPQLMGLIRPDRLRAPTMPTARGVTEDSAGSARPLNGVAAAPLHPPQNGTVADLSGSLPSAPAEPHAPGPTLPAS